jgi:hypothetical protein
MDRRYTWNTDRAFAARGFIPVGHTSLAEFASARSFPRSVVCFSDTHLLPDDRIYGDDAPNQLADLLGQPALRNHAVYILGDFLESLVMSGSDLQSLSSSRRLKALFETLDASPDLRIIPGNHDARVHTFLHQRFGPERIHRAGFDVGGIRFRHGHTEAADASRFLGPFAAWMIPFGVTAKRIGIPVNFDSPTNEAISRRIASDPGFAIFGHTHAPEVSLRFANCGSFLRFGPQTIISIANRKLTLWSRHV